MWIRGPSDAVVEAAASDAGVGSYLTITADEVADIPFIKAAIDTFVVLDVLGVVALLLVLVVGVVYLQARQRSRILSMALSTRMGLGPGTMRRSLVLELMIVLFAALAVGATTGLDRRGDRDPLPRSAADDPAGSDRRRPVDRGGRRRRWVGARRVRRRRAGRSRRTRRSLG